MDSHLRSVVKGMSWRVVATVVTVTVVYLYSGKLEVAALAGSTDALTKIWLFWGHERLWQKIHWGRVVPPTTSP